MREFEGGALMYRRRETMVSFYNPFGKISMSENYFAELVGYAAKSTVGVAGMATLGPGDSLKNIVQPDFPEKGVRVSETGAGLCIELHIKVAYGINVTETVKSLTSNVKYAVEQATGLDVKRVDVSVDDVVS
ncbi:Asp23/Gls24 family envelope stress response protein [Ruminococcaceae bacterium OttesenSCG-928-I18]|nr:Asp23/Gls24 family envelope stress response protein [Ruminococcaceae bacterium OttesenSCG-928-I18]